MINIENVKAKSLHDLLVYREALLTVIDKYEKMMDPRFSRIDERFDKITPEEFRNKEKLSKAQGYLQTLMLIIEEKTYKELEEEIKPTRTNKATNVKTNKNATTKTTKKKGN